MQFTLDVKEFGANLRLLTSAIQTGGSSFTCSLVLKKSALWFYANNETVTLKCKAKGVSDISGTGIAGIDTSLLEKAIKGREGICFTNEETVFKFKVVKGAYGGTIAILPVLSETIDGYDETLKLNKKADSVILTPELFNTVRNSLASTSISILHASDSLDTYVSLKKKVLEVVSSDNFHLAYCKVGCKTDASFQLSPTKTVFDVLGKLAEYYGGETKVEFSTETIKASNPDYVICMPTLQSSDTAFVRAKSFIDDLPKPHCSFSFNVAETSAALDNILAIYEDGALINLELKQTKKGDTLTFSMTSNMGMVSDSIKVPKFKGDTFKCQFDPRMFIDSLNLSKCSELTFSYILEKAIVLKSEKDGAELLYVNSTVNS